MTPILVIRHAPTDWNRRGLIQGRMDRPLDDVGRLTARSWRLPEGWAGVVCLASPLLRALETAQIVGLAPTPEPDLIEMHWGQWEGRRLPDLHREFGEEFAQNEARGLDFRPPGGESPRDVQERLQRLLGRLTTPTIMVTHKGVLRALYALATGWSMVDDPPEKLRNSAAHIFAVSSDGRPVVERLNIGLEA
jgi:probable phosphoglycerate mutase